MMKRRYFIDMDGVLNKWNFDLPSYDCLFEEGYFAGRPPQKNILRAVSRLVAEGEEVFVLSAVLKDSKFALFEKHDWLDKHLPTIPCKRRIFTICGEDKISYVPAFNPETDILVDDYGENCRVWAENGGAYVKVSVDISDAGCERDRHKHVISPDMSPAAILTFLKEVNNGNQDER